MAAPTEKKVLHSGRHASAMKRARQNTARKRYNTEQRKLLRASVKAVRGAVARGDRSAASTALQSAIPAVARIGGKGIIPKTRASRLVSRLTKAVQGLPR
ncbi:MAG: 30S ribosomal protein S20 [Deltaproteobacteria bacterium]|nr:30S ribosomal protein S20 [Deltaproteobacteria bacterium]